MKLVYLSSARVPDDWGHVFQIMKTCEALARTGIEVELLVPRRREALSQGPFEHAKVEKIFTITRVSCIDLSATSSNKFLFYLRAVSFFISAKRYLSRKKYDVLYTREHLTGLFFKDFFYEAHTAKPIRRWFLRSLSKARGIVALTEAIQNASISEGFPKERIYVEPDAVDAARFGLDISKEEARTRTTLPLEKMIVGYSGTLKTMGMEKGVAFLIESLTRLPEEVIACVVGGEPQDIVEYQNLAKDFSVSERVVFIGKVPQEKVPLYLRAFDVVVAPFPDYEHYRLYMSPLKIFEYMAAGVPMVVSDLPSLREVLSEKIAYFVKPGDSAALAGGIKEVLGNPSEAKMRATAARMEAQKYTWDARAKRILSFTLNH